MLDCLAVGIGGFAGSILRYLMGMIPLKNRMSFPVNTLLINIAGAFLIGLIVALFSKHGEWNDKLLLMLKVGLCGGFTTFSTFSFETLSLFQSGRWVSGILYAALSVVLCVAAVYAGQLAAK